MLNNKVKTGTMDPKGSIRDIECGFVPSYVKVFNANDAGSLYPTLEWFTGMGADDALKTKMVADNGSTGNKSQDLITSNGITVFNGEAPSKTLVGTHAITLGASALTGSSSKYIRDLRVGDIITVGGRKYTVATITSDTAATIVEAAGATETAAIMTRETGRAAGFTLGLDTDVNATGEAIFYLAIE